MAESDYILNLRTQQARQEVADAIYEGERLALDDTVRDAKAGSPRVTGRNADSITARLRHTPEGNKGTVFTTSGYGGLLEAGFRSRQGHPYIYPAANTNLRKIPEYVKEFISRITSK